MTRMHDASAFLETTPLVPIELDASDGAVRFVGQQSHGLLGHPVDVWYDDGFWARTVLPDDQSTMADARRNSRESRGGHEIDYRMEHADGRVVWVSELVRFVESDGEGTLRGFLWNVTDRKRQEVALWRNEERLRALLRKAPDALILTDEKGAVINMNDQAVALFGYELGEIVGSNIEHLLPEALRPRLVELRAAFERDPARRSLVDGESFSVQRADGSEVPVELSLSLVSNGDEGGRILWSARDLTVRRRVEAQRRAQERAPADDDRPDEGMACSVDGELRVVYVSDGLARHLASARATLEGRPLAEVLGERLVGRLQASMDAALAGSAVRVRCDLDPIDGAPLTVDAATIPRHDGEGRLLGCSILLLPTRWA